MAKRIGLTTLNASSVDVINTIRQNASPEYQQYVPAITNEIEIPKVGEALFGYPALANQFISTLVNRIAAVRIKSANFNNMWSDLKKGYLGFGETVEESFVSMAKAREFSVEKAESREFKRTIPDVKTAFHSINWRVQYPVTIQDRDLRQAFTSAEGVNDLIAKITNTVYTGNEYDEMLLMKYLIIKAATHGKMLSVAVDSSDVKNLGVAFRGYSNIFQFMSDKYNEAGVWTVTPIGDQCIFMDAMFNAQYDVDVLSAAFNMDRATYTGALHLTDNWTTFDNKRFDEIKAGSDMIEDVTAEELAAMANVKAVLLDREWFQLYDNLSEMSETFVSSGLYWNYFYNVWKIVSSSPFSNAVVFVDEH